MLEDRRRTYVCKFISEFNSLFLKTTQIKDHRLRMKIISYMYSDYRAKVDGIKMIPVDLRTHLINFIIGKLRSLENATKANYKRS